MLRWLVILVNLVISLFIGAFFSDEVSVQLSAPQTVTAGDEFKVKVKLNKGKIESFSRLLQELPAGLKATSINSANADFTFKDNKIRLIWLKMPDGDSVTVEYTIKTDQRLKGTFDLSGKFSYIDNNERMTVEATPLSISINPNPNIDPKLIVDIKDFKEQVIPELNKGGQGLVACVRQKPQSTGDADNSYIVNLLVYKENAQKFAKIEETVPAGYTALKIDSKEGIFVYKDGLAKFLWMSLPTSSYFTVSYRLVPNQGVTNAPTLKGQFSYVADEKTITKDITEKDLTLASLSEQDVKNLIKEVNTKPSVSTSLITQALQTNEPTKVDCTKVVVKEPTKQIVKNVEPTEKKSWFQKKNLVGNIDKAYTLEPEDGVYFRVQIAAGHKAINVKRYFNKFKIAEQVRAEDHEGWHKYSIGSFADYRQARDYRVHIWNTTTISDAFVSAYNSGKRITVQEALMITNQQWYK